MLLPNQATYHASIQPFSYPSCQAVGPPSCRVRLHPSSPASHMCWRSRGCHVLSWAQAYGTGQDQEPTLEAGHVLRDSDMTSDAARPAECAPGECETGWGKGQEQGLQRVATRVLSKGQSRGGLGARMPSDPGGQHRVPSVAPAGGPARPGRWPGPACQGSPPWASPARLGCGRPASHCFPPPLLEASMLISALGIFPLPRG